MEIHLNTRDTYDTSFYARAVELYINTGECNGTDNDELYNYMLSIMNDPFVKIRVLTDPVCARVFYDMMIGFIWKVLGQSKFNWQKSQGEINEMEMVLEWSQKKRRAGIMALLKKIEEEYQEQAFDHRYYKGIFEKGNKEPDDEIWLKMVDDWKEAFRKKQAQCRKMGLEQNKDRWEQRMRHSLNEIPNYLKQNKVEHEDFFQCWGLMGGIWNEHEFERIRNIVQLQKDYPEIIEIANQMGRVAEDEGTEKVRVSAGGIYKLEHSSKSDIQGITVGRNLNALLPSDRALAADDELENLFIYNFLSGKLQNFRYKSEIMKPARKLEIKPARLTGPMIVCLDTSGSMVGKAENIANSLLVKLLEIADKRKRDCFLIAFSVSVILIDIRKERKKLLDFFSRSACGDTDATIMMEETFKTLSEKSKYMNADVLWITDFRMLLPNKRLLQEMLAYRELGTRFYGMQIGTAEHSFKPYFDKFYRLEYTPTSKY